MRLLRQKYLGCLRPYLSTNTSKFWDSELPKRSSMIFSGSFSSLNSYYHWAWNLTVGGDPELVLSSPQAKDAKMKAYLKEWKRLSDCVLKIHDHILVYFLAPFLGNPIMQLELCLHKRNFGRLFYEGLLKTNWVTDNYFMMAFITGSYTRQNCPRYMKKGNFARLKASLAAGKLTLRHGTVQDALRDCEKGTFTAGALLDHMDWLNAKELYTEITLLVAKMDKERGRIFWRSLSEVPHSAPLALLNPKRVDTAGDRVPAYYSTWSAHLRETKFVFPERIEHCQEAADASMLEVLSTGVRMVTLNLCRLLVGGDRETHIGGLKEGYDGYWERFCHGRPYLMQMFPIKKTGRMVWIDIGGGTARNLEFLSHEVLHDYFEKILIVDASPSMLEIAQKRIRKLGLEQVVTLMCADVNSSEARLELGKLNPVDVITFSYCLEMIPNNREVLRFATGLLKPGGEGFLGIADFALWGKQDLHWHDRSWLAKGLRLLESQWHKLMFRALELVDEDLLQVAGEKCEVIAEERVRGGVPFHPYVRPFHIALLARTKK